MNRSPRPARRLIDTVDAATRAATQGGVLLRPGGTGTRVRNVETGRVLPCCWDDCMKPGSTQHEIQVPHPTPKWKDPKTGNQEMLVYIFCSAEHKAMQLAGTPLENRA